MAMTNVHILLTKKQLGVTVEQKRSTFVAKSHQMTGLEVTLR